MRQVVYRGVRAPPGCLVWRNGAPLPLENSFRLRNHSPTGWEWGYNGSGPAQLALALLQDVVGDALAQEYYQEFKQDVVAALPHEGWELTAVWIEAWVRRQQRGEP